MNEINESHLFIGLITDYGDEKNRVIEEWRHAVSKNIPNLLLIEDTVPIQPNFRGNYVRFNRFNPQSAMNEINKRMTSVSTPVSKGPDDIIPWILGGAALLAILSFLNDKK